MVETTKRFVEPPLPQSIPPFGHANPDQLKAIIGELNLTVRYLKERTKVRPNTIPNPYADYLLERTNEERGATFGEMLFYRATHPDEHAFFTAKVAETSDAPQPDNVVVFEFPDLTHPRGYVRTQTRLEMIYYPNKILDASQAKKYVEGNVSRDEAIGLAPIPNLTSNAVSDLARKINLIDTIEANASRGSKSDQQNLKRFLPLKYRYLLQELLPARRGKALPHGSDVRVLLIKDPGGREVKNRIDIVIEIGNNTVKTTLSVGSLKKEVYDRLLNEIGEFDVVVNN
ncbi:MAG: hypothetical protein Q8Q49_04650 [bacterium]|nr:hypothetical protein [bacterium]